MRITFSHGRREENPKDDQTPLDQFLEEQMRILEEACNEFPERQREAIILLYFEEMNYEEVARVMNIGKVRSARALIYCAIDSLKHILDPMKSEFVSLSLILMASLPRLSIALAHVTNLLPHSQLFDGRWM